MEVYRLVNKNIILDAHDEPLSSWGNDSAPESDSTPHINVGREFQCSIPPFMPGYNRPNQESSHEDLLWDPGINKCTDSEGEYFFSLFVSTVSQTIIPYCLFNIYI